MKIVETKPKTYKGYTLIEGFPSPDLIATITTRYLVQELKMKKIGHLESEQLFPVVRLTKGLPEYPIRLYASDKHKLIAIVSDQIIPNPLIFDYCKTLINWVKAKKIKQIFTLASVQTPAPIKNIYGATNNEKGIEFLKKHKVEIVKEGLTSGLSAQLLIMDKNIPTYLLLAPAFTQTNLEAAAKLL